MGRLAARDRPESERVLVPARRLCPACGAAMRIRYENRRTLVTLEGAVRLRLKIRRCEAVGCVRHHRPWRPEAEGAMALPQHEFGLDVVALVGVLRHRDHRSVPEIHAALRDRGVEIAERSVTNLLDRYDELLATALTDGVRLRRVLCDQGRAILALDGLQPDVGHEVLWVVRECLSGEVVLARSLLSGTAEDLAPLLVEAAEAVGVPVEGVISDGQTSIRRAVARALPGVPHQLCQFHLPRARRQTRSTRPTGTPRRNSRRVSGVSVPSNARWRGATMLPRRWCAATARRCAVPSPMTAARRSQPPGCASRNGWRRWRGAWTGCGKRGRRAPGTARAAPPADWARPAGHGRALA